MFPGELRFLVRERHHISIGLRLRCYILLCPLFLFHELLPLNRGFLCKHLSRWTNALPVADCVFSGFTAKESPAVIHYFALFPVFPALLIIIFFYSCPLGIVCPKYILRASSCLRLFFQGILARQYNNDLFMFLFLLGDCKLLESRNHVIFFVIFTLVPDIK